ncbi:recombinase RecT [Acinetobacter corruptisaponis]|uniref:Recombinase RecT n=1 Tax=Acinetobacter corruptisaponis TaxID=3045147 RepID=A0ABY8S5A3_9GAMM|nr:recombinase RecT [Acinetobacter sp. KCTC 92772]WHP06875.1 recombinase RecT [Acinetobacter sp. KCTC 92772]
MNAQNQNMPAQSPAKAFQTYMLKYKSQLEAALPKHLTVDRMIRLSLTAFSQNPALQQCTSNSIFSSIIIASQLGLEPGVNGQGYLVPYKDKCTFIPGWKGLVDLAQRGGRSSVWTGAVYEGDEFDYMLGDSPYCRHKPCGEFDVDKLTHVYAIGRVKDSEMPIIEVWPVRKVREHFKKTVVKPLQPNHYSHKHFEAYARKVALLQVLKYMPQSIELSNAMDVSNAQESGKGVTIDGDFVTVDTNQYQEQDQNVQTSTQNEVSNHQNYEDESQVSQQKVMQNEVVEDYAPTFTQIKRGILSAKSPAHLDVMEEQAMDHADKEERKQLMTLIKAQGQKFQPIAEVSTAKKPEPVLINDGLGEVVDAEVTEDDLQQLEQRQANDTQKIQSKNAEKATSLSIRREYLLRMNAATSQDDLNKIHDEFLKNDGLTGTHLSYLKDTYTQLKQKFTPPPVKEEPKATVVGPDPIKSNSVKAGLERMIAEAKDVVSLEAEVARTIKGNESKLTQEHNQAVSMAYAHRKEVLSQQDIFEDELSLVDSYLQSIEHAASIDRLNEIMSDPAVNSLPDDETAQINNAYDRRYAELQG